MDNFQHVTSTIISKNGTPVVFHTIDGGALTLNVETIMEDGFYITLSSAATEGLLNVIPYGGAGYRQLPFFKGPNSMLIKAVASSGHTANNAYWSK